MAMTQAGLELPRAGDNGRARAVAMTSQVRAEVTPTSIVTYLSQGRLLIIGDRDAALSAARKLDESLQCALMFPGEQAPKLDTIEGMSVIAGGWPEIEGSLGAFSLNVKAQDEDAGLRPGSRPVRDPADRLRDSSARLLRPGVRREIAEQGAR